MQDLSNDGTMPALFVTAMLDGHRHEDIFEPEDPTPLWFVPGVSVRVVDPKGIVKDFVHDKAMDADLYPACMAVLEAGRPSRRSSVDKHADLPAVYYAFKRNGQPSASRLAGQRIVAMTFSDDAVCGRVLADEERWLAASADACLTHRTAFAGFAARIEERLGPRGKTSSDLALLHAVVGMARLAKGEVDRKDVHSRLRHAVRLLASAPPRMEGVAFILNGIFSPMEDVLRREAMDVTLEHELRAIDNWLRGQTV